MISRWLYKLAWEVQDGVEWLSAWIIRHLHKGKPVQEDFHTFMLACLILTLVMIPVTLLSVAFDRSVVRTGIEITLFLSLLGCLFWWFAGRFAPRK